VILGDTFTGRTQGSPLRPGYCHLPAGGGEYAGIEAPSLRGGDQKKAAPIGRGLFVSTFRRR
jgi:hypothetical protein